MRTGRAIVTGLTVLVCACGAVLAGAAGAAEGAHLPGFSLLNRKVALSSLSFGLETSFQPVPGQPRIHGPVWFGEVDRPSGTISGAGVPKGVCDFYERPNEGGGAGTCVPSGVARTQGLLTVESCGKGHPTHFRIDGLIPDGVTGLEVGEADGTVERIVPVLENTVAFSVRPENVTLRGVGDTAAAELETRLPLSTVDEPSRGGCTSYAFPKAPATR